MKDYANILIFLAVFISLSERTYASIDFVTNINEKDTVIVLYFGKNQNNMDEYYANNKQALSTIDSLLQQSSGRVNEFEWQIKSYASPNGVAIENKHMTLLRSESVKEFLQKRYLNIDISKVKLLSEGEDWAGFRKLVAADQNLPDREEVLMLIDHYPNDVAKRKELIEKLDRGIPYRYIVQKVLPKLRRSEVRVSWKDLGKAETVVEVSRTAIPDSCQKSDSRQVDNREIHESAPVIVLASEKEKEERGSETILAIKNNLIYDLALAPNIEIEIPIGKKWSFNAEYKCPWWMNNRHNFCYQLLSGGVEARIWLGNRQKRNKLTGHFLGLYAEGGIYDFQFSDDKGYQGKYYGASGLTYGYALQLARHFSMEFSLGVGYLTTEYKKYVPYEGDIVRSTSGRYNFIGPTKLKVSLVWLLTKRR